MQYKCDFCNDTGSLDQDEYMNCGHCGAADDRVALNAFVRSLGVNLTLDERTWAIHQRALAMATKQEAPAAAYMHTLSEGSFGEEGWNVQFLRNEAEAKEELAVHGGTIVPLYTAPAAANGALKDEQIEIIGRGLDAFRNKTFRLSQGQSMTRPEQDEYDAQINFARAILASAGPDAALVKALEDLLEMYVRMANSGDCGFWNPEEEQEVIASRADLSGAKGN